MERKLYVEVDGRGKAAVESVLGVLGFGREFDLSYAGGKVVQSNPSIGKDVFGNVRANYSISGLTDESREEITNMGLYAARNLRVKPENIRISGIPEVDQKDILQNIDWTLAADKEARRLKLAA